MCKKKKAKKRKVIDHYNFVYKKVLKYKKVDVLIIK